MTERRKISVGFDELREPAALSVDAYRPPRHVRIAALAYIHHRTRDPGSRFDREDFDTITAALGLDELLVKEMT